MALSHVLYACVRLVGEGGGGGGEVVTKQVILSLLVADLVDTEYTKYFISEWNGTTPSSHHMRIKVLVAAREMTNSDAKSEARNIQK